MTLTSILPTLRRSIPSPFSRDAWPARTVVTCDDVIVAGISVTRFVSLCDTPCVMTAPAVIPLAGGMPSPTETATVLTARVVALGSGEVAGIALDADLAAARARWEQARLIGRISVAADHRLAVYGADGRVPGIALICCLVTSRSAT